MADKIEKVEVTIRNTRPGPGLNVYTDVVSGPVEFKPGEVKTIKVSEGGAEELKELEGRGSFEMATKSDQKAAEKAASEGKPLPGVSMNPTVDNPGSVAAAPKLTKAQLEEKTKEELLDLADDKGISVAASWTKADIVDAINKAK